MPVNAFKYDSFAVDLHKSIFDLKGTESDLTADRFSSVSFIVNHGENQCIQIRCLSTPLIRIFYMLRKLEMLNALLIYGSDCRYW
ncbi:hypothetical protein D3C71_1510560 [compost metagenome]